MIDKLKEAGLSEYEAKAYVALLELRANGGQAVARVSGVPPTRVYEALHSLVEKGLASKIQEKPLVFKAIAPEIGLKHLFDAKVKNFKESEKGLIESLKKINVQPVAVSKIHEKVTTVMGYEKMFQHVVQLLNQAKKEFLVFSVSEELPYALKIASKRAVRRGVKLRIIATQNDEHNQHILKERVSEGWQVRHHPSTGDYTFAVFDRKIAFLNVKDPAKPKERISTIFEVPGMAKAMSEYFEQLWKKSKQISV